MTTVQDKVSGDHFATTYNGVGSGLSGIPRSGLAASTANQVVINGVTGLLTSEAQLAPQRGGTGIDTSALSGVAKISTGTWSVGTIVNADVNATAAIARTKLASGSANNVVINDGTGAMTSEARLAPQRGGTGIDTSAVTGVAKVSAGTWSISSIVDADVSAVANIQRSKLSSGTANQVVINNGSGVMTSEAQLAVSRGGTGQDFSAVGAGPFITTVSNGIYSATLRYSTTSLANALVQMDGSGNISIGSISATQVNTNTIVSTGTLTITASTAVNVGAGTIIQAPTTVAGGSISRIPVNVQTVDATLTTLATIPTTAGAHGSAIAIRVFIALGNITSGNTTGMYDFYVKAKNIGGVLTISSPIQSGSTLDTGLTTTSVAVNASGTNILIQVTGVAATTIYWLGSIEVLAQQF